MKTTNFEISKKLAEIGFKAETHLYYHFAFGCQNLTCYTREEASRYAKELGHVPCFDLETLIDALPESIQTKSCSFKEFLKITRNEICYCSDLAPHSEFFIERQENESLADCAARLLIKLHEQGSIKFGE